MSLILQTLEPKIAPQKIEQLDLESSTTDNKLRSSKSSMYLKNLGRKAPIIKLGEIIILPDDIISMEVFHNEFIPKIHVSLIDKSGSITSTAYPKTNPLLTAYVASTHPKLKSFCQTFIITKTASIPVGEFQVRYDFFGELYVPGLNSNFIKSYPNMTSEQTIRKTAEELKLGFATNEDSMSDSMTWINPNLKYSAFIKRVTDHAYKNEKSFFDCFIDRYYTINFINVEKQFNGEKIPDQGYPALFQDSMDLDRVENTNANIDPDITVPIVLSNSTKYGKSYELFILDYSLAGENGEVLNHDGFKKRSVIYKHGEANPVKSWFAEPISSPNEITGSAYQRPELEDYLNNEVVKWMGVDYSNSHNNYKFSKIINYHNKLETEKTVLIVELPGFNQNIVRGSYVKVEIYKDRLKSMYDARVDNLPSDNEQKSKIPNQIGSEAEIRDNRLSDFYYVKEISYFYGIPGKISAFQTKLVLSRKSWIPEPKIKLTK